MYEIYEGKSFIQDTLMDKFTGLSRWSEWDGEGSYE
jgi:hypothetical protein